MGIGGTQVYSFFLSRSTSFRSVIYMCFEVIIYVCTYDRFAACSHMMSTISSGIASSFSSKKRMFAMLEKERPVDEIVFFTSKMTSDPISLL